jgi:hypothetical protein
MTPSRPRLQHLLPKINTMASCPSRIHHQLVSFFVFSPCHHALPNASAFNHGTALCRMTMYSRPQTPLPNALRKTSCRMVFFAKFGSHVSLFPVPIFGVNKWVGRWRRRRQSREGAKRKVRRRRVNRRLTKGQESVFRRGLTLARVIFYF